MPGHWGGSHSHGDKKSNNRTSSNNNRGTKSQETYRTSKSYKSSVTSKQIKESKEKTKKAISKSALDNYQIPKSDTGLTILDTALNAAQKLRQKSFETNRKFYQEKVLKSKNRGGYEDTLDSYESYMSDRLSGKVDAYGNPITRDTNDGRNNQPAQPPEPILVTKNVGGTEVQTTEAKLAEEKAESEEYDARKTKRRGRRRTILTSQTGASGNLVLGKPSLLGA